MEAKKKFILTVQGEGRGHMTQAISMYELLIANGHEVSAVILGSSGKRETAAFFYEKVKTKIVNIKSPNFSTDKKNRSIRLGPSIVNNLVHFGTFRQSLRTIRELIEEHKPDAIVNFFDLLIGLYYLFNKPDIPLICIAHQYIYLHPDFTFPKGRYADRAAIKFFTRLTSSRSKRNLALSFYRMGREHKNVVVVPPLLRKEIFELNAEKNNFFLIYLVNNGYLEDIIEWHKKNPTVELHCFTDKKGLNGKYNYENDKLVVHQVNDTEFLEKMAAAKGLVSTAGFESVCEAMYLGKPVLMVPIHGHYEQFCNSRDAYKAGAGVYDTRFNIDKLIAFSQIGSNENVGFRQWVSKAQQEIYGELCAALA